MDENGRRLIGVRGLLEWAFGAECASLDYDDVRGRVVQTVGNEYRILQQLMLGTQRGVGVKVDTSFGSSRPAADADIVSSIVVRTLPWARAVEVTNLARLGRVPDWRPNPQPRCEPTGWRQCKHGRKANREFWRGRGQWPATLWGKDWGYACPVTYVDSPAEISQARARYTEWRRALAHVRDHLQRIELERFAVTDVLPKAEPWIERC